MTIARVAEITASSPTSFADAINQGFEHANNSLEHIEGAWVKEMKVVVRAGRVEEYRINMKLTVVDK